jgi:glycosyltransferase involved in cell wall biosynthesis
MPEILDLKFITQQKPLVSICVLTYNHENFVKEAIESFLMQRVNFDIEIVIHDDASTDQTQAILKKYDNDYPNLFKLLLQSENQKSKLGGGMGPRFNYSRAKGKYIAMCEGDDYWTDPLKLQKQVDFLERNLDCSFCFTRATKVFVNQDKPDQVYPHELKKTIYSPKEYLDFTTTATCSLVFRNLKLTEGINFPVLEHSQGDFILYCHLLHYGNAGALNDVTCTYNKHEGGVSFNNSTKHNLFRRIKELKIEQHFFTSKEVKKAISKQYVIHINKYLKLYPQDKKRCDYLKTQRIRYNYYLKKEADKILKKLYRKAKSFLN